MPQLPRFVSRALLWILVLVPLTPAVWAATDVESATVARDPRVRDALGLLARWLDSEQAYRDIPGLSYAVVADRETLVTGAFGLADRQAGIPATPSTVYSICSISKLFTSVALMQLRDEDRLRLDDPVSEILPWFEIGQTFEGSPPVTVRGILTHSSGLPRESDYPYWSPPFDFPSRNEIQQRVAEQSMLYPSSRVFQYSNLGLTLAGEIVSQLTGRPYAEVVRDRILEPLGMESTNPEIPEADAELGERMAKGYSATRRGGDRLPVEPFRAEGIAPAAGYVSTVGDLARFAGWQLGLLSDGEGNEVLSANTLREMHRVHWVDPDWKTTWGLGFSVSRDGDETFVGHGGSCPGYRSHLRLQPKARIATVFMANALGVNPGAYTKRAHELVAPAVEAARESPDEGKETDPALMKFVGAYDEYPWSGETQIFPWEGGLAVISFPTEDPAGSIRKLEQVEGPLFRRVRRDGEAEGETFRFELDDNGEVTSLWHHSNPSPRIQ